MIPFLFLLTILVIFIIVVKSSGNQKCSSYQTYQGNRMLCKSQSNRVFAGVCGGIAEHFGWNATIVRLFFILSGIGLLTYIILALVIPDSPSSLL